MIKAISVVVEDHGLEGETYLRAELISDEKEEIIEMGNRPKNIYGIDENNVVLTLGSTVMTSTHEFGILNSAGEWKF